MKKTLIIACSSLLIACGGNTESSNSSTDENAVASSFVSNTNSLLDVESKNPIDAFKADAANTASKQVELTKDNVKEILSEAANYKTIVITTGNHTIVKVVSLSDCTQSASWGACMPKVEGYIKKGNLVKQEDYLNNVIGLPDNQERMVYFFK